MRICELKQKEVINIHTCRSLGCPLDVEFCCETARLKALIMPEPGKFCWCFSKENEYSIPWDCIRQIGEDIILVDFRNRKTAVRRINTSLLSRPFIFYIFPEKVYFNRPLRIILMY